jgi:hypothetical protein
MRFSCAPSLHVLPELTVEGTCVTLKSWPRLVKVDRECLLAHSLPSIGQRPSTKMEKVSKHAYCRCHTLVSDNLGEA